MFSLSQWDVNDITLNNDNRTNITSLQRGEITDL